MRDSRLRGAYNRNPHPKKRGRAKSVLTQFGCRRCSGQNAGAVSRQGHNRLPLASEACRGRTILQAYSPAAIANGTVSPSDIPITTSLMVSEPVKCCLIWVWAYTTHLLFQRHHPRGWKKTPSSSSPTKKPTPGFPGVDVDKAVYWTVWPLRAAVKLPQALNSRHRLDFWPPGLV